MATSQFTAEKTKTGYPALWECGGGSTNTGYAQVICGPHGEALQPVYIKTGGERSNGNHALFIVDVGYHIVEATQHRGDYTVNVYRIVSFKETPGTNGFLVETEKIREFSRGEWDYQEPGGDPFEVAVVAACKKAEDYHCRTPYYWSSVNVLGGTSHSMRIQPQNDEKQGYVEKVEILETRISNLKQEIAKHTSVIAALEDKICVLTDTYYAKFGESFPEKGE
jgi:hypothetical protein